MGWFGFEDAGAAFAEIHAGRASYDDLIWAIVKGPTNKIGQSISPMYKVPFEIFLGKQFFPDVWNPRSIKERDRHAAQTFSLGYPLAHVKKALGEPSPTKPLDKTVTGALVNFREPGQIAYDNIRSIAFTWVKKEKGKSVSSSLSEKSKALYNYRLAIKYNDCLLYTSPSPRDS